MAADESGEKVVHALNSAGVLHLHGHDGMRLSRIAAPALVQASMVCREWRHLISGDGDCQATMRVAREEHERMLDYVRPEEIYWYRDSYEAWLLANTYYADSDD